MGSRTLQLCGLPLRCKAFDAGELSRALAAHMCMDQLCTRLPKTEPCWEIVWRREAQYQEAEGEPVRIGQRGDGTAVHWRRILAGDEERFLNVDDATEVTLVPQRRMLGIAGLEAVAARRGYTLQESLRGLMRGFLLGRGWALLHAAAVVADDAAILLAGAKGAGKTTLQLALIDAGASFLSADRTFVASAGDGSCWALPWPGALRVRAEDLGTADCLRDLRLLPHLGPRRDGRARIPFEAAVDVLGRNAVPIRIRSCLIVERGQAGSGLQISPLAGEEANCRFDDHLLTEVNETRPDWLQTERWWPRSRSTVRAEEFPVFLLAGHGAAAAAADKILAAAGRAPRIAGAPTTHG